MTRYAMTTKNHMITYSYEDGDWGFSTNLFCEVGEPYQPWFRNEIERRRWTVETRDLEEKPWVADFVIGRSK